MIKVDMNKAKQIAHELRREARAQEFQPYDEVIMKQIPGNDLTQAEIKRQEIREKYTLIQQQMNEAQTAEELKNLIPDIVL